MYFGSSTSKIHKNMQFGWCYLNLGQNNVKTSQNPSLVDFGPIAIMPIHLFFQNIGFKCPNLAFKY